MVVVVVEGVLSNLFWVRGGESSGGLTSRAARAGNRFPGPTGGRDWEIPHQDAFSQLGEPRRGHCGRMAKAAQGHLREEEHPRPGVSRGRADRTACRLLGPAGAKPFEKMTRPTALQQRALSLLGVPL